VKLSDLSFRIRDNPTLFQKVTDALRDQFIFNKTLWSYSLQHGNFAAVKEFIRAEQEIVNKCRPCISSNLLTIEPEDEFEHLEYRPLINHRAHHKYVYVLCYFALT
jgi:hypothetical protein